MSDQTVVEIVAEIIGRALWQDPDPNGLEFGMKQYGYDEAEPKQIAEIVVSGLLDCIKGSMPLPRNNGPVNNRTEEIDRIINLLRATWHANSELRLGQLVDNIAMKRTSAGPFYVSDSVLEEAIKDY